MGQISTTQVEQAFSFSQIAEEGFQTPIVRETWTLKEWVTTKV
jgi:hypothetical protein